MYLATLIILLSAFFLMFFWVMMLGNRVSHTIEQILAKDADEELANINLMMSEYEQKENKKK
ncbi:hypothetical protein [Halalkalibacter krulwichiae]|uniref:Uncharacterized protein n=1 Tax=Halalkalibacter krulwichiae TaxID=199441 RepID=A0A1X9MAG9_9BACI|nr:hypothetical protein [Halalkalibacter krulwichiae]ARK30398.1 hypothetical protein BkAM31D_11480 [Halalkalibacter krulwichiae]